jgi:methionyl-tRNA synthetase
LKWIDEGLVDWDTTRDLSWGVPITKERARGQVFYGWFDNHICYISSFLALLKESGNNDGKKLWNDSEIFHFIGKDIVYHHYLFLPSIRMGINYEYKLPDSIPTRGHLMLNNRKISKSRSWYIGLRDFLQLFPSDYLRFYLARVTPYSQTDINFDWDVFIERINNELIANVGNFIHRTLSFIKATFGGIIPNPSVFNDIDLAVVNRISGSADLVGSAISINETEKAMKEILDFSTSLNRYFQKKKPWVEGQTAQNTLYISANAVRSLAILLDPFLPKSSEKIWNQLGLAGSVHNQNWNIASQIDMKANHRIGEIQPLFQKIEKNKLDLDKWKVDQSS